MGKKINPVQLASAVSRALSHPTSNPYETRPTPDGYLTYQIIPIPDILHAEKDVIVTMPDGVKLACNIYRDATFWGGIPETNFLSREVKARIQALPPDEKPDEAAKIWAAGNFFPNNDPSPDALL